LFIDPYYENIELRIVERFMAYLRFMNNDVDGSLFPNGYVKRWYQDGNQGEQIEPTCQLGIQNIETITGNTIIDNGDGTSTIERMDRITLRFFATKQDVSILAKARSFCEIGSLNDLNIGIEKARPITQAPIYVGTQPQVQSFFDIQGNHIYREKSKTITGDLMFPYYILYYQD